MIKLDKIPSDEVFSIELYGRFIPEKFHPSWFVENKLLGLKEAAEANIINITTGEMTFFSTQFIRIYIDEEKFKVSTKQLLSYDLVKDMIISIAKILEDAIFNQFSINILLHFSFKSSEQIRTILNNINNNHKWNDILVDPQVINLRIAEERKYSNKRLERIVSMSPCEREDMPYTLHLYVKNLLEIKTKQISIFSAIEEEDSIIKESIDIVNKIIKTYL